MKIPKGMEAGDDHPVAQAIRQGFPDAYIGATLFRGDLSVHLKKAGLHDVCRFLKDDPEMDFDYPIHIASVDDPAQAERFEVVHEFFSIRKKHQVRLKTRLRVDDCTIASVVDVWKGADFLEREVFDMMGIRFIGHPNLKRILLPDEYDEGYPLRKDFPVEGRGWRDTFEFLEQ
jgi:NADH-quinone oxidoreductase subunit C